MADREPYLTETVTTIAMNELEVDDRASWFKTTARKLGIPLDDMVQWKIPTRLGDALAEQLGHASLAAMLKGHNIESDIPAATDTPEANAPAKKSSSKPYKPPISLEPEVTYSATGPMKHLIVLDKGKPRKPKPKPPTPVTLRPVEPEIPAPTPPELEAHPPQMAASEPEVRGEPPRQMQAEHAEMVIQPPAELPPVVQETAPMVPEILVPKKPVRTNADFINAVNQVGAEKYKSPSYLLTAHNETAHHILNTDKPIDATSKQVMLEALRLPDEDALYQISADINAQWQQQLGPYTLADFLQSAKILLRRSRERIELERPGPLLGDNGKLVSLNTLRDVLFYLKEPEGSTAQSLIEKERATRRGGGSVRKTTRDDSERLR